MSDHCGHVDFVANVAVNRLTDDEGGPVTAFHADVTIECADCHELGGDGGSLDALHKKFRAALTPPDTSQEA